MRQKASELVKGEWYADLPDGNSWDTFLRFSHNEDGRSHFSEQKGSQSYRIDESGFRSINSMLFQGFIPTPEDIEKYKLNEKE